MAAVWTPPPGRHRVQIGSSLVKALKARRGGEPTPTPPLGKKPEKNFYSLRYKFKPSSVDTAEPGSLDVKGQSTQGDSLVRVEYPSTQPNEAYTFKGVETAAKDWACVLIYDEETGYSLEKLDSFILLDHPEKRTVQSTASSSSSAKQPKPSQFTLDDELEREFDEILPDDLSSSRSKVHQREELEEGEEDEDDIPLRKVVTQAQPKKPPPTAAPTPTPPKAKTTPKPRPPQASAVATPPSAVSKGKRPAKAMAKGEDADARQPPKKVTKLSPPPKRPLPAAKPAPPPKLPAKLELPGSSAQGLSLPGASGSNARHPASAAAPPPPTAPSHAQEEESEEEDWEEVGATTAAPSASASLAPTPAASVPPTSEELPLPERQFTDTFEEDDGSVPPNSQPMLEDMEQEEGDFEDDDMVPVPVEDSAPAGNEIDMDEFEELLNENVGDDVGSTADPQPEPYQDAEGDEDEDFLAVAVSPEPRFKAAPVPLNQWAGGAMEQDDYSSTDDSDDE